MWPRKNFKTSLTTNRPMTVMMTNSQLCVWYLLANRGNDGAPRNADSHFSLLPGGGLAPQFVFLFFFFHLNFLCRHVRTRRGLKGAELPVCRHRVPLAALSLQLDIKMEIDLSSRRDHKHLTKLRGLHSVSNWPMRYRVLLYPGG